MNELLTTLRLRHVAQGLPDLFEQARLHGLTYDAFLRRFLLMEIEGRKQAAEQQRWKTAKLPARKTLEEFDFSFQPTIPERQLWELADLSFVAANQNIVFLGPPGVGKTHLAIALAVKALAAEYSVLFTSLAQLAEDLAAGSHTGGRKQRLRRYLTPRVLVIDEIGYSKLTSEQSHAFFELVRDRYEKGSIILTSNTSFSEWGALLNDEVVATALLDRLLHHVEVIPVSGKSFRMKDHVAVGKAVVTGKQ